MNTDKLHSINPQAAIQSAYAAVSAIQDKTSEEQLAGITVLLYVMAKQTGQGISHLMAMAERVTEDADSNYHTEIRSLHQYCKEHLK